MWGFSTGVSALTSARVAIQTAGHNLANATTPGYSRQRVTISANHPDFNNGKYIGRGVSVKSIDRISDELLLDRIRQQRQQVGRSTVTLDQMLAIETAYGEPSDSALSAQLGGLFNSLSSLSTTPDDSTVKNAVALNGQTVAEQFQRIRGELADASKNLGGLVDSTVAEVNRIASSLGVINEQLNAIRGTGEVPPDLLDQQSRLLDELSDFVDISVQNSGAGRVSVTVGGQMLVSETEVNKLEVESNDEGYRTLRMTDTPYEVKLKSGRLQAYIELQDKGVDERIEQIDGLANALIMNFNRIHATGVPASGGFRNLQSNYQLKDQNSNGNFGDEILSTAGLPFDMKDGKLWVSVIDDATGAIEQTGIDVDPDGETVAQLVAKLDGITGLKANVDGVGRLNLTAANGTKFHFGAALDTNPNGALSFGNSQGQVASTLAEPFALSNGDTMFVAVDGGPNVPISLNASAFVDITKATSNEVAAAINSAVTGATASVVDGRVVITSDTTGTSSSIQLTDGAGGPLAKLGLSSSLAMGSATAVDVEIGGSYTGDKDEVFSFRPVGNGTIGTTPGLQVEVLNSQGQVVSTLDVGQNYSPGTDLPITDGMTVSFGIGDISASGGDFFSLNAIRASDTSDVLAAFGLNAFFEGSDASSIAISQRLIENPELIAQGLGPAAADNRNALRFVGLRDGGLEELDGRSAEEFYQNIVSQIGLDAKRAELNLETETLLQESFENRLEQVRGVSIDEELAELQRYEQAYQAAAEYVSAISEMTQILLNL